MSEIYPTSIEEALPDDDAVAEARERLEAAGVKYVLSCWIDLLGVPKTKPVPISQWETICRGKGPQFAVHSISYVPELGPADPDQIPIPDVDSLVLCPWNREIAFVFADLFMPDGPYAVCPRLALKRQVEAAAAEGYRFFAGVEPEFMVMRYDEDGEPQKAFDDDPAPGRGMRPRRQAFGYDVEFSLDAMPYVGDLIDHLEELGWGLRDTVAEGAYSQIELDFGYTDMLGMADRLTFLRIMLKEVAKEHGLFVTFMPKPTTGDWRSGAHINHSMQAVDRPGVNLFEGENGAWNDIVLNAVGGILQHGAALTAIAAPTVNSYKGLVERVGAFEGGTVTWAPDLDYLRLQQPFRHAAPAAVALRDREPRHRHDDEPLPELRDDGRRFARRESGTGSTPDHPPRPPCTTLRPRSCARRGARVCRAPSSKPSRAFDADPLAREVLGSVMHDSFSRYKHDEWNRYSEQISRWEQEEYMRLY